MKIKSIRFLCVFAAVFVLISIMPMAAFASYANDPDSLVASKFLSENINWDNDGNAKLTLKAPNLDIADGRFTLNKADTVETLISKIANIGADWGESNYKDMIRYDQDTGTYGLFNSAGGALDGAKFSIGQFDSDSFDLSPGTSITLSDFVSALNSYTDVGSDSGSGSNSGSGSETAVDAGGMSAVLASMTLVTSLLTSVWQLMTSNALLTVFLAASLVGVGITVFQSIKNASKH